MAKKTPEQLRAGLLRCIENQLAIGAEKLPTMEYVALLADVQALCDTMAEVEASEPCKAT